MKSVGWALVDGDVTRNSYLGEYVVATPRPSSHLIHPAHAQPETCPPRCLCFFHCGIGNAPVCVGFHLPRTPPNGQPLQRSLELKQPASARLGLSVIPTIGTPHSARTLPTPSRPHSSRSLPTPSHPLLPPNPTPTPPQPTPGVTRATSATFCQDVPAPAKLYHAAITYVAMGYVGSCSELKWRNRQTRTVQVRVPERAWGFNSPLEHSGRRILACYYIIFLRTYYLMVICFK